MIALRVNRPKTELFLRCNQDFGGGFAAMEDEVGRDGFGVGRFGICGCVWDCGRLLPQTIPHPIRGETAKRMGHPDLGLGDGLEVLAAQAGALAAAAGGEDVAALVTGFGGFHRLPLPRGGL